MRTSLGLFGKLRGGLFLDVALLCGAPQRSLLAVKLCSHRLHGINSDWFIGIFEFLDPLVQALISDFQPLGNIKYCIAFVNNLAHCFFIELRCVLGSLHLHFSHSDFDNNICLLNWGNATEPANVMARIKVKNSQG